MDKYTSTLIESIQASFLKNERLKLYNGPTELFLDQTELSLADLEWIHDILDRLLAFDKNDFVVIKIYPFERDISFLTYGKKGISRLTSKQPKV